MLVRRHPTIGIKVVGRIRIVKETAKILRSGESKAVVCIDLIRQVNYPVVLLRCGQWYIDRGIGLIVTWSTAQNQILPKGACGIHVVIVDAKLPVPVDLVKEASGCGRI